MKQNSQWLSHVLHLVEYRSVDLGAKWLTVAFRHNHIKTLRFPLHPQRHDGIIGQDLPADDIARNFAVNHQDLITHHEPSLFGR